VPNRGQPELKLLHANVVRELVGQTHDGVLVERQLTLWITTDGPHDERAAQRAVQLVAVEPDLRAGDEADRHQALDLPERIEEVQPLTGISSGEYRGRYSAAAKSAAGGDRASTASRTLRGEGSLGPFTRS
jgi:hypothetical protein